MRLAASVMKHVLDFCYPTTCAACGASEPDAATPGLCASCVGRLAELAAVPGCERCAKPLAYDRAPCPYCEGRGFRPFERIACIGVFDDPLKHLIHQAKYHRQWMLAELLADRLLELDRVKSILTETDVLVAVPLHSWRHIARGYNQAEVVARRLARRTGHRLKRPAVRMRRTVTQTNLPRSKRVENLRGAFVLVDPRSIEGRHVTIVDDVMTTGATLRALAKTLKEARPASLSAVVLAIADPRGKDFEAV